MSQYELTLKNEKNEDFTVKNGDIVEFYIDQLSDSETGEYYANATLLTVIQVPGTTLFYLLDWDRYELRKLEDMTDTDHKTCFWWYFTKKEL